MTHASTNLIRSACNDVSELAAFLVIPKLSRNWQHKTSKHIPELKSD